MKNLRRTIGKIGLYLPFMVVALLLLTPEAHATGAFSTIQNVYKSAMGGWFSTLQGIANGVFLALAAIDITWMALTWLLTRKTFDEIIPSLLKKVMTLGFFLALLTNAGTWVPDIISGFVYAGKQAGASYQTLTPSTIMTDAVGASVGILTGTTPAAAGQPAPAAAPAQKSYWEKVLSDVKSATSPIGDIEDVLLRIIVAIVVFAALTYIAIELLVLLIESYVVMGAGVLFLGFGGSRWTTKFVDGYLNYAVSLGTKLFILYLIVGTLVYQVLPTINTMLSSLSNGFNPTTGLAAMGATVVMAMLAKTLPHHASSLLSGASSLSGSHGVEAGAGVAKAGAAVVAAPAALAAGAAGAAAGAAASAGGGTAAAGGAASATGASAGGVAASGGAGVAAPTGVAPVAFAGGGSGAGAGGGVAAPTSSASSAAATEGGSASASGNTAPAGDTPAGSTPAGSTPAGSTPTGSPPAGGTATAGSAPAGGQVGVQTPAQTTQPSGGQAGTQQDARTTAGNNAPDTNGQGTPGKGSKGVKAPQSAPRTAFNHAKNALTPDLSGGGGASVSSSHISTKHLDD
ncbi:P-type conjugative transfer protein TrbL [Acidithiobacillus ferrivorans SS3]|uniref:P-type conjugative transfer protein TrbL n=1 Tax=Acidithiobacillus ferrivorans SS3 TaxID=743299 RepID=G0JL24_9PROT|nr:P-type conjugative transfer protein TrbL [Acidithiobacillus ferrivorans]AEM48021.1 P-type conjugative transfer protein TrbL [Acidithiobacillus ferrivorans SS3]